MLDDAKNKAQKLGLMKLKQGASGLSGRLSGWITIGIERFDHEHCSTITIN